MPFNQYVANEPNFTRKNFKTHYKEPVVEEKENIGFHWYRGQGIKASKHPLRQHIDFGTCANCESSDVLVIAAQFNVHMMSGDKYYDYEIECQACGKFTRASYAEND